MLKYYAKDRTNPIDKTNPQMKFLNITRAAAAPPQSPDPGGVQ